MSDFRELERAEMPSLALLGLQVIDARETASLYVFKAETTEPMTTCPKCGVVGDLIRFSRVNQDIRDTPIHGKHVRIMLQRQRYRCKACGKTFHEPLDWLHEDRRATRRLVAAIERDSLILPNTHTAHKYGVDDKTIKNILDALVKRLEQDIKYETPRWLGIDEVHVVGRPRAVFTNIGQETLIEMLTDRNKPTIVAFLRTLDNAAVKGVTMDMWKPYKDAVREVFPQATITIDKFHVVRLANYAVEKVRKAYKADLTAKQRRRLRNDRFTLLKRRRDLNVFEAGEIETWRREFPELIAAYEAKELFYSIYDAVTEQDAKRRYAQWLDSLPESKRAKDGPWYELVTAMTNWEAEIFAYFQHRLTNAYTESMNRIIRDIDRGGRGYSFPALRAKVIFGQEFRKKSKLASQSKRAKNAFRPEPVEFMSRMPAWDWNETATEKEATYGADIHRVADYLEGMAKQHAKHSPPRSV